MTLKITDERAIEGTIVRVEGRLEGEWVPELDEVCRAAHRPLRLQLEALLNVDSVGLGLLRALAASGATLDGASPYIRLLIESEGAPLHDTSHGRG
jgi:anti-anti-sigma regulatory factor